MIKIAAVENKAMMTVVITWKYFLFGEEKLLKAAEGSVNRVDRAEFWLTKLIMLCSTLPKSSLFSIASHRFRSHINKILFSFLSCLNFVLDFAQYDSFFFFLLNVFVNKTEGNLLKLKCALKVWMEIKEKKGHIVLILLWNAAKTCSFFNIRTSTAKEWVDSRLLIWFEIYITHSLRYCTF